MPTAAKLFAAVAFAALAFVAAEAYKTTMLDRTVWGQFSLICAAIGGLCGWFVMGGLVGRGYSAAMGFGLRTAVTTVFWLLLGFSIYDMVIKSTKGRYAGPMEAILGAFDLMVDYGRTLLTVPVLGTLLVGGLVAGVLAEWAGRRWR